MQLLYAIEIYDDMTHKWVVFEHPDEIMRQCSPVIVYSTLEKAEESLCAILRAKSGGGSTEPLVRGRFRISFYRPITRQDHGYHTSSADDWLKFGEAPMAEQIKWSDNHYKWLSTERD
jgi:hypothetical protein